VPPVGTRNSHTVYASESVDPAYAPGTGTPEVGGFTGATCLQLLRGLTGIQFIGYDLRYWRPISSMNASPWMHCSGGMGAGTDCHAPVRIWKGNASITSSIKVMAQSWSSQDDLYRPNAGHFSVVLSRLGPEL
jgi:hypothetical protein